MTGDAEIWRPDAVARLASAPGRVILVVGESGSGKSRVLEQTLIARAEPYGISELRRSDAVQIHLQRALAELLRRHLAAGADPAEVREQLRGALVRLGARYTQAAASAITRRVLDVVTKGVAPEIQQAFHDLAEELAAGAPERVLERLQEASDDSPLEQVLELGEDVSKIVGCRISLGLDRGEYLSDADVDLLLDLAEEPQECLTLCVAIQSDHYRGERVLQRFAADDPPISGEVLRPLDSDLVQRIVPQLSLESREQLLALSGGSPRRLADALHLPHERWWDTPRLALALTEGLSPEDRARARALSVLPFSPSPAAITRLLGLDDREWVGVRRRLEDAGIVEPGRWIHEARRSELIPEDLLERGRLAADALAALAPDLVDNEDLLGQVLELAHLASPRLSAPAAAVIDADIGVLGVVAGWFELQSTERERPLLATTVALYAHQQWAAPLLDAAGWERMTDSGLVSLETSDAGQTLVARPHIDDVAFLLLRARLLTELGRVPLPYLAEMVMLFGLGDEIAGRANSGPRVGVSAPSDLLPDEASLRSDREDAPTLMITARFRQVPVGVGVRFESQDELRATRNRLLTDRHAVFGKTMVITGIVAGPPRAQPSERWAEAAELAGLNLDKLDQRGAVAGHALAEARSSALDQLRDRLTPDESLVAALDQPIAIGVAEADGQRLTVEFRGARHGALDITGASATLAEDPLRALRQVDDLITTYGEHVGESAVHLFASREHPLPWAIERVAQHTRLANRRLPRVRVDMYEQQLQARLTEALERRVSDALLMQRLAGEPDPAAPPDQLVVVLPATAASPMWQRGDADALAFWMSEGRGSAVEILWRDDIDFYAFTDPRDIARAVGLDTRRVARMTFASAKHLLASLLGYQEDDIELHLQ